jgi:hypothetical protein
MAAAQSSSQTIENIPPEATSTAPVAYVYVSTSRGVNLYDAAANGQLKLVSGSPFAITGEMIGSNGKHFISLGTDYVHSYFIASNGAIRQQESQINTQQYSDADCGTTAGAVLDHTGHYVYVQLAGALNGVTGKICDAYQTFRISSTSGSLTFTGATKFDQGSFAQPATPLAIMANGLHAYNQTPEPDSCQQSINAFYRESSGTVENTTITETDPAATPGPVFYIPNGKLAPDPANHFAVAVIPQTSGPCGTTYSARLASYAVDNQGNITSTNDGLKMPTPTVYPGILNMSPSGKLLAVGGTKGNTGVNGTPYGSAGLQVFHFNGAALVTHYSAALTKTPIDEIHWDNANHLYALSNSTGKLYVFTVTPTSITQVSGSPYTIAKPNGLFVVPR